MRPRYPGDDIFKPGARDRGKSGLLARRSSGGVGSLAQCAGRNPVPEPPWDVLKLFRFQNPHPIVILNHLIFSHGESEIGILMTTILSMLNSFELGLIGCALALALAFSVFWIWALVDCARRVSAGENGLVGWLIAICLTQVLGASAYVIFARRRAGPTTQVQHALAT